MSSFIKLTSYMLLLLVLIVLFDVLNRYIFNSGSILLQELQWHLFAFIFLISISYTQTNNAHVRVDIFYTKFSKKKRYIIDLLSNIFIIIPFSVVIIYYSFDFVTISYMQGESSSNPGGLEARFIIKSIVILAFVVVIFESISKIREIIKSC